MPDGSSSCSPLTSLSANPAVNTDNAGQPGATTINNIYPREYCPSSVTGNGWRGKRCLDIVGALLIGAILSPAVVVISCLILLSGGSVLFSQQRIGKHGKHFTCHKFRTMVPDADKALEDLFSRKPELRKAWLRDHKLKNDPRITRVGKFLRSTSLDEIPQLINVLRGEMSLVGPRPIVEDEIFRYGRAFRHYVSVRPGLTGLWQVSGRNDVSYFRRVAFDRIYSVHSCIGLDLRILFRTPWVMVARLGAY